MCLDRFGNELKIGDKIVIDYRDVQYSKCKDIKGWKILHFVEHLTETEVVAVHTSDEIASFPVLSVHKAEQIKKFLNKIALMKIEEL